MGGCWCEVMLVPCWYADFLIIKVYLTELERRYASVLSFSDRPHCTSIAKALIKFNILGYAHLAAKKYSEEVFDAIADKLSEIAEVIIVKGTCISPCLIEKIKKISPRTRIICYSWVHLDIRIPFIVSQSGFGVYIWYRWLQEVWIWLFATVLFR